MREGLKRNAAKLRSRFDPKDESPVRSTRPNDFAFTVALPLIYLWSGRFWKWHPVGRPTGLFL
jgi:hypothetical protein